MLCKKTSANDASGAAALNQSSSQWSKSGAVAPEISDRVDDDATKTSKPIMLYGNKPGGKDPFSEARDPLMQFIINNNTNCVEMIRRHGVPGNLYLVSVSRVCLIYSNVPIFPRPRMHVPHPSPTKEDNVVYFKIFTPMSLTKKLKRHIGRFTTVASQELHACRALRNVSEPTLGKILDVYEDKKIAIIAMEYSGVDGVDCLINGKLSNDTKWWTAVQHIISGVSAIHSLGFSHRDIKPENICFRNGQWKIIDFGLSVSDQDGPDVWPTLCLCNGTIPYQMPAYGQRQVAAVSAQMRKFADMEPDSVWTVVDQMHAEDYYATSLTLLALLGIMHEECCSNCIDKDKQCEDCEKCIPFVPGSVDRTRCSKVLLDEITNIYAASLKTPSFLNEEAKAEYWKQTIRGYQDFPVKIKSVKKEYIEAVRLMTEIVITCSDPGWAVVDWSCKTNSCMYKVAMVTPEAFIAGQREKRSPKQIFKELTKL